ncbi:hypothetical protein ACS0TY_031787 [Phlomoides rotata]
MRHIKPKPDAPWMCIGDFNEILWSMEKSGGNMRNLQQMESFQETINELELQDLNFKGYKFTWSNGRVGPQNIQVRLDRALANPLWRLMFPTHTVYHRTRIKSDHSPIVLECNKASNKNRGKKKRVRLFQFEKMWMESERCKEVVEYGWNGRNKTLSFRPHKRLWDSSLGLGGGRVRKH